jgi:hypothetical protein
MYKMVKTDTNGLTDDLIVTGGHSILVDDLEDCYEQNIWRFKGNIPKIDDKTNTITYTAHGAEADKIKRSKVGVVVHQQYHGDDIGSMKVSPHPDLKSFKAHADVHMHGAEHDTSKVSHSDDNEHAFQKHMAAAKAIHDKHGHSMYNAVHPKHSGDSGHLATYINKTVRHDEVPNVKGFKQHLKDHHAKQAEKVKTEKSKSEKTSEIGRASCRERVSSRV